MTGLVIDSSIALTWCFEYEASPETDKLFERVRDEAAIVTLARTEHLTTYHATYLELARRRGLPLLTKDNNLAQAASRHGVPVLPSPNKQAPPARKPRHRT